MILTEGHVQILKDIHMFSRIKRYHGMLPQKDVAVYDDKLFGYLIEKGLVEEGCIFTTCGSNPKGYRLSEKAHKSLKKFGIDLDDGGWDKVKDMNFVASDQLAPEHVDVLRDIHLFSQIKQYHGIAPKSALMDFDPDVVKYLYDAGYIFHIKLKGQNVKHEKGYILSEKAMRVLRQLER